MKQKTFVILAGAGAAVCALCFGLFGQSTFDASLLFTFPFAQTGALLRGLSLASAVGNGVAWGLYVALGLLPAAYGLWRYFKNRAVACDVLLAIVCILALVSLYGHINPWLHTDLFPALPEMGAVLIDGTLYGVLGGYIVLRFLRSVAVADTSLLLRRLGALLLLIAFVIVLAAFGVSAAQCLHEGKALAAANTGADNLLPSYLILFLCWAAQAFSAVLDVIVLFAARDLTQALCIDPFAEASVQAAQKLSKLAMFQLAALTLCQIALALLQLVFARALYDVDISFTLSLSSLALGLALLLFGRFAARDARLKEENDLFI